MKRFIPPRQRLWLGDLLAFLKSPGSYFMHLSEHKKRLHFYKTILGNPGLVFDVGANVGNRSKVFSQLGNKVIAVEPQPSCATELKLRLRNRVTVLQKGVSNERGKLMMNISTVHMLSTFRDDFGQIVSEGRFGDASWNEKIGVEVITLQDLIDEYGEPTFIKVDVEGFEKKVFQGLREPVQFLSFEYTVPEMIKDLIDCLEILKSLSLGYQCNYSVGESMNYNLDSFMPIDSFIQYVKQDETFRASGFGDIYCKIK